MSLESILADKEFAEELMARVGKGALANSVSSIPKSSLTEEIKGIVERVGAPTSSTVEAIILQTGRPALVVKNGTFQTTVSDVWNARLEASRAQLERAILAVGRIELKNHPDFEWIGTGWFVANDIVVTNRHVAEMFASGDAGSYNFRTNVEGKRIGARIDLREEYLVPDEVEFEAMRILHIEPDPGPDMAFLQVAVTGGSAPAPLMLASDVSPDTNVAVIGYPAWDGRRNDPIVMRTVFNDLYDVKRLQPGRVMTANADLISYDCSTLGGNSGSPVITLLTGEVAGLHFGGSYAKGNYGVSAAVIRDRLINLGLQ